MSKVVNRGEVWLADLNPRQGTEAGKVRPVVVVQTDLLNAVGHPSTVVCPITSNVKRDTEPLRVNLPRGEAGLTVASDVMVDQVRAIDNGRLIRRIGTLSAGNMAQLEQNLRNVLDL